jgi:hypothetical protein
VFEGMSTKSTGCHDWWTVLIGIQCACIACPGVSISRKDEPNPVAKSSHYAVINDNTSMVVLSTSPLFWLAGCGTGKKTWGHEIVWESSFALQDTGGEHGNLATV